MITLGHLNFCFGNGPALSEKFFLIYLFRVAEISFLHFKKGIIIKSKCV